MSDELHGDVLLDMIAEVAPEVRLSAALRDEGIDPDDTANAEPFDDERVARILRAAGIAQRSTGPVEQCDQQAGFIPKLVKEREELAEQKLQLAERIAQLAREREELAERKLQLAEQKLQLAERIAQLAREREELAEQKRLWAERIIALDTPIEGTTGWVTEIAEIKGQLARWNERDESGPVFSRLDSHGYFCELVQGKMMPLPHGYVTGVNLSGADLSGADLFGANLSGADLGGAKLTGADFSEAELTGADLSGAKLTEAKLTGADLSEADLSGAELTGADLSGADLSGANLSGADLSGAQNLTIDQIIKARGDLSTQLPEGLVRPAFWRGTRVPTEEKRPRRRAARRAAPACPVQRRRIVLPGQGGDDGL